MKKIVLTVFVFSFLLFSCNNSSSTSTNNGGTNENKDHETLITPLSFPKPEVDFNSPILNLDQTEDPDTVSNFLSDCISTVKNESEFIEKLFLADEDLSNLTQTSNTTWRGDDFSATVSRTTEYTYISFFFDFMNGVGAEREEMKIKNDRSYAEVVAYQNGSPYISAKATFNNDASRGEIKRYGGYFENLATIFTYSTDNTSSTGKVQLYQNGNFEGETALSEDDQSNPVWGECVERGVYGGSLLLNGDLRWNLGHGEYHILFRNSDGSVYNEIQGNF